MDKILNLGDTPIPQTGGHNLFGAGLASAPRPADLAGQLSDPHSGLIAASGVGRAALVLPKPVASPIFLDSFEGGGGLKSWHKITDYFTPIANHSFYLCGPAIYNGYTQFSPSSMDKWDGTTSHPPLPSLDSDVGMLAYVGPKHNGASYPSSGFKCFSTAELNIMAGGMSAASVSTNILYDGGSYLIQSFVDLASPKSSQPTPPWTDIWRQTASELDYSLEDIPISTCGCSTQVSYRSGSATEDGVVVAYGKPVELTGAFLALPVGKVGGDVLIHCRLVPHTDCTCYYSGGRNKVSTTYYDPGEASLPLLIYVIPVVGEWSNTWNKPISLDPDIMPAGNSGSPHLYKSTARVSVTCPNVPSGNGRATGDAVEAVLSFPIPESRLVYIMLYPNLTPEIGATGNYAWKTFVADQLKARLVGSNNLDTFLFTRGSSNITFHTAQIMRKVTRKATLHIGKQEL